MLGRGDSWLNLDYNDLIIYETHVRDMTRHLSSEVMFPGTYIGFIEKDQKGGIEYLKKLGVNAVQLLPVWDYANIEIPFKKEVDGMFITGIRMKEITGVICQHSFLPLKVTMLPMESGN